MTEQVIDIRDRIEKMRTQMTVPGTQAAAIEKKVNIEKKYTINNPKEKTHNSTEKLSNSSVKDKPENHEVFKKVQSNEKKEPISQLRSEVKSEKIINDSSNKLLEKKVEEFQRFNKNTGSKDNYRKYDDYQNDRIFDEKKQSVKIDENQPFPQFSLNVSNPISWKLMLLIMLMQLLTNMMLVVVLYLK